MSTCSRCVSSRASSRFIVSNIRETTATHATANYPTYSCIHRPAVLCAFCRDEPPAPPSSSMAKLADPDTLSETLRFLARRKSCKLQRQRFVYTCFPSIAMVKTPIVKSTLLLGIAELDGGRTSSVTTLSTDALTIGLAALISASCSSKVEINLISVPSAK